MTADTRWGLYASRETKGDTLPFVKFGQVTANGVPFNIVDPAKAKDLGLVDELAGEDSLAADAIAFARECIAKGARPTGKLPVRGLALAGEEP